MNKAVVEENGPGSRESSQLLDRWFPTLWVILYLLLPVSGWASEMFDSWFDQQRDLEALRTLIANGHADAIASNGIGPAYIGLAALVHDVLRLSPEDSLVAVTRASYVLSVAVGLILVRVLVARWAITPPWSRSMSASSCFSRSSSPPAPGIGRMSPGDGLPCGVPCGRRPCMPRGSRAGRPSVAAAATTGACRVARGDAELRVHGDRSRLGIAALGFGAFRLSPVVLSVRRLAVGIGRLCRDDRGRVSRDREA